MGEFCLMNRAGECTECGDGYNILNIIALRNPTLAQHRHPEELKLYPSYFGTGLEGQEKNLFFNPSIFPEGGLRWITDAASTNSRQTSPMLLESQGKRRYQGLRL